MPKLTTNQPPWEWAGIDPPTSETDAKPAFDSVVAKLLPFDPSQDDGLPAEVLATIDDAIDSFASAKSVAIDIATDFSIRTEHGDIHTPRLHQIYRAIAARGTRAIAEGDVETARRAERALFILAHSLISRTRGESAERIGWLAGASGIDRALELQERLASTASAESQQAVKARRSLFTADTDAVTQARRKWLAEQSKDAK